MTKLLPALVLAAALAGGAQAQQTSPLLSGAHVGVGYQMIDVYGVRFDALSLRTGFDASPYFGVEVDGLIGLGEESRDVFGATVRGELKYGAGAYLKAQYPLAETVSVFARGGYVYAEVEGELAGVGSASADVDGWSYGVGGEWAFSGPNAVRVDYTRHDFVDGNGEAESFGVSYVRRF